MLSGTQKSRILFLGAIFLVVFGFNTLDWLFNTPIKAWEFLELIPDFHVKAWYAYISATVCLFLGGLLLGFNIGHAEGALQEKR